MGDVVPHVLIVASWIAKCCQKLALGYASGLLVGTGALELEHIFVDKQFRLKGHGKRLLQAFLMLLQQSMPQVGSFDSARASEVRLVQHARALMGLYSRGFSSCSYDSVGQAAVDFQVVRAQCSSQLVPFCQKAGFGWAKSRLAGLNAVQQPPILLE